MANFLKHAERVGLVTALIEAGWTFFTSAEMHYDDKGCLHSTRYIYAKHES
jgi:hypothetical protein